MHPELGVAHAHDEVLRLITSRNWESCMIMFTGMSKLLVVMYTEKVHKITWGMTL